MAGVLHMLVASDAGSGAGRIKVFDLTMFEWVSGRAVTQAQGTLTGAGSHLCRWDLR